MTARCYPNLSEEYERNFRHFRQDPLRVNYWACRRCWQLAEEHFGGYCAFSPHKYELADVEEDLTRRNVIFGGGGLAPAS